MVLPIIQYADSHQQQSPVIYRYGNEYVQFSGQNAYVGFGDSICPVSWAMYQINPVSPVYTPFSSGNGSSPLTVQTFSHYRTTRIENAYQNSAVMIRWNHNIRIAEIFSFLNGAIDASVAIKNVENSSGTFMSAFSMTVNHSRNAQIGGFNPQAIHSSRGMGDQKFLIGGKNWNIDTGGVSVSWKNEQSVFSAGMLSISSTRNAITLPFGPLSLAVNETYSVDPMIRPYRIIGGGGGSSSPNPPVINSVTFSYTNDGTETTIPAYTPVAITAVLSSMGSYNDVSVNYFVLEAPGIEKQAGTVLATHAGTFTLVWNAVPGPYQAFGATPVGEESGLPNTAGNGFSIGCNINVYSVFPNAGNQYIQQSSTRGNVYNSSGHYLGSLVITIPTGAKFPLKTDATEPNFAYSFTFISPNNSGYSGGSRPYGIFSYSQGVTFQGSQYPVSNVENNAQGSYLNYYPSQGLNQAPVNGPQLLLEKVAYSAAVALLALGPETITASVIMAALYPLVFQQSYQFPQNATKFNNIWYNRTANLISLPHDSTWGTEYFKLRSSSNNNLSLIHSFYTFMQIQKSSGVLPYGSKELVYFDYTTGMKIVPVDLNNPWNRVDLVNTTWVYSGGNGNGYWSYTGPSYGISTSEPYYLAQE
ncbi:MAG: hypothetical protein ACYC9S_13430, partial [Leptospirales bacterium]